MSATPNIKLNVLNDNNEQLFYIHQTSGAFINSISNFNNTTESTNSTTASSIFLGGVNINCSSNAINTNIGGAISIAGGLAVAKDSFLNRISAGSIATPGLTVGNIYNSILYSTSINTTDVNVTGNVTIGGNLIVLGQTTIINLTTANQIESNVTSSNIFLLGNLIAGFDSHTLGNIFTTGGNVGINTTNPSYRLDVIGDGNFSTGLSSSNINSTNVTSTNIVGQNISSSTLNVTSSMTAGNIYLSGTTIDVSDTSFLRFGGNEVYKTHMLVVGDLSPLSPFGGRLSARYSRYASWEYVNGVSGSPVIRMLITSSGNVGIGTTNPSSPLQVNGVINSTSITTGQLQATTSTIPNMLNTNITTVSLLATSQVSSGNVYSTNVTSTNIVGTNISSNTLNLSTLTTGSLLATTDISSGNVYSTNVTSVNIVGTNISSSTLNLSTITTGSLLAMTQVSSGNLYSTNVTSTDINATNISSASLNLSTGLTSASLIIKSKMTTTGNYTYGANGNFFNTNVLTNLNRSRINRAVVRKTIQSWSAMTTVNIQIRDGCWSSDLERFVITGVSNQFLTSTNGINWTTVSVPQANEWTSVCWSPEVYLFVAVSSNGTNRVITSSDGITWITQNVTTGAYYGVCWSPDLLIFVAVGTNVVITSPDGVNWTTQTVPSGPWFSVCWSSELNIFVAVSTGGGIITSSNGINWNTQTSPTSNSVRSVCWSPELHLFVAVDENGTTSSVITSPDGVTWSLRTTPNNGGYLHVEWSPYLNVFVAVGTAGAVMSSFDGITWTIIGSIGATNRMVVWSPELNIFVFGHSSNNTNLYRINPPELNIGKLTASFNSNTLGNLFTIGGNVGIGTAAPTNTLDVNSTLRVRTLATIPNLINTTMTGGTVQFNNNGGLRWGNSASRIYDDIHLRIFTDDQMHFHVANTTSSVMFMGGTGDVGIGTTSPGFTLDVNGSIDAGTFLTSGNVYSTNITSSNIVGTNISSSTLNLSTLVSSQLSAGNILSTNVTSTNLVSTSITANSLNLSNLTAGNIWSASVITTSMQAANSVFTTGITTGTALINNSLTSGSIFTTALTAGTIFSNALTIGSILATGITSASLLSTTSTLPNAISTNISSSTLNVTNEIATNISSNTLNVSELTSGNINFTGSLYQNGQLYISSQWTSFSNNVAYTRGNVGINTTTPSYRLDINGDTRIQSTQFSSNSTSGALVSLGGVSITGTNASSSTNGGALTVNGGIAVSGDTYIGTNLYIQGINSSVITGNELIGSNSGTGTYQTSVSLSRTMPNTNYKIVGNLKSTSSNMSVFTVSFCNLTTTGFTANIYRIDALGAGWTDANLTLSYVIYP